MPDNVTPPEPQKQPEAKPSRVSVIAAQLQRDMAAQAAIDSGVAPVKEPPAEKSPAPEGKTRDESGRFVKKDDAPPAAPPAEDPSKAAMREVIKRQKAKEREYQQRISDLERRYAPMAPVAPPQPDPEAELLATMPEETKTWWKNTGDKLVDHRIHKALSAKEAEAAARKAAEDDKNARFVATFDDFVADRLVENEVVDERKFMAFLDEIDANGWRFGREDSAHIEQAYKMFKKANAQGVTPVRTPEEAEKSAKETERAAARSGGTPPSSQAPPQMDKGEYGRKLREAVLRGDHAEKARLLRDRFRGTILERTFNTGAGQEG